MDREYPTLADRRPAREPGPETAEEGDTLEGARNPYDDERVRNVADLSPPPMRTHQIRVIDASTELAVRAEASVQKMIDGTTVITLPSGISFNAGDTVQLGKPTDGMVCDSDDEDGWITRTYPDRVALSALPAHNLGDHTDGPDCWCCPTFEGRAGELTTDQGRDAWERGDTVGVIHRSEIAAQNANGPIPWMT